MIVRVRLSICRYVRRIAKSDNQFVMSVRLSVRLLVPMGQLGYHWTDYHEFLSLIIFRKSVHKIQVSLKSDKYNGYFT